MSTSKAPPRTLDLDAAIGRHAIAQEMLNRTSGGQTFQASVSDVPALVAEVRKLRQFADESCRTQEQLAENVQIEMRLKRTAEAERDQLRAAQGSSPDDLRALGWSVGVHNDFRQDGKTMTFWLMTFGQRCVKGEAETDAEALDQIRAALAQPSERATMCPEPGCVMPPHGDRDHVGYGRSWPSEPAPRDRAEWEAVDPNVRRWIVNTLLHWAATTGVLRLSESEAEHKERQEAARAAINLLMADMGYALALDRDICEHEGRCHCTGGASHRVVCHNVRPCPDHDPAQPRDHEKPEPPAYDFDKAAAKANPRFVPPGRAMLHCEDCIHQGAIRGDECACSCHLVPPPATPEAEPRPLITDHKYERCTLINTPSRCPRVPFQLTSADLCHWEEVLGVPCGQPESAHTAGRGGGR